MTRMNVLLLLALLASSLYLVNVSYESRRVYFELDRARTEERQLASEFKRLDAERHAQATNLRVEKVARDKLGMRNASPAVTQFVLDPAAAQPAVGVQP
jgi:cell division protein FtsL